MSQAGLINMSGGGGSGTPIQTITGDTGGPVPPTANNINIVGGNSTQNNTLGITVAGNAGTSTETVTLTNRITGTATTTDAITPMTVYTFPLGTTPGTYLFTSKFVVYDLTDSLSAGYASEATVRTDGATATLLSTGNFFDSEEGALSGIDVANTVTANSLTIVVMGLLGKTIHYFAKTEYIFVS